jgi:uncharacterized membrane protein
MEVRPVIEALVRWLHVFAGIIWIGHLYFFNWVNGPFAGTMDKDTKQKVVPELMPRALFWFRWGAAWTWLFGYTLLGLVFYMAKSTLFEAFPLNTWGPGAGVMATLVLVGPFIYDALCKSPLGKNNQTLAITGIIIVGGLMLAYTQWAHFTYRASLIHLGATFGTIMAYNVWFRIWPLQQKIISAVKAGQAPDPAWAAVAGGRSKHNTYMSVPLVFAMLNMHMTAMNLDSYGLTMVGVVVVGWLLVQWMYKKAATVKGF